jgi:hypothetical protein
MEKFLYHYDVAVKFKNRQLTTDQLRTYIVGLNPVMDQLPSDLIPLVRGSIVKGSSSQMRESINKMLWIKDKILNTFVSDKDNDNLNDYYCNPIINAISNYTQNCIESIQSISDVQDPVEVLDKLSGITLPDLDQLVLLVRDVQKRTAVLDKV